MSTPNGNISDLSDKYTKKGISNGVKLYIDTPLLPPPIELFYKLHSKCIYPINPINTPAPDKPAPPLPDREPKFTEAEERLLCDFYCSRPRAERLAMHQRSLYARTDKGWSWDACFIQAYREAWDAAGRPQGPFVMADDGFNNTHEKRAL